VRQDAEPPLPFTRAREYAARVIPDAAPVGRLKHYTFVDYATQAYLGVVALLVLCFHNQTVPGWRWLLVGHVAAMALVHGLITGHGRGRGGPGLDFLRHFYPVLLYTGFYRETGLLNRMFQTDYLDPTIIRWEQAWFGGQPSVTFMQTWPLWWVSEVLYTAYFSYYVMIAGVGLALFLRQRASFFHYVSVVSFVFYVCYLTYIFVPVIGPRIFFREVGGYELPEAIQALAVADTFPSSVTRGWMFRLMAGIYHVFEAPGAAFPSSHVAVAVCTLWFSFLYLRRIRFVHAVAVVLLCVATIYCRYHYVVDVLAGLLTAAVLVPLGNWLYRRFNAPRSVAGDSGALT
jgi:membrane-associated phospholipid phosphatase